MQKWLVVVAAALALTGCSRGGNPPAPDTLSSSTYVSTAPVITTIEATVNTQQFEFAPMWIPVQLSPEFKEGQSITLKDEWPTHGTVVEVQCWINDGEYLNPATNALQYTWYKIYVPADKIDPVVLPPMGGEWGYVEAFWLDLHGGNVKECIQ